VASDRLLSLREVLSKPPFQRQGITQLLKGVYAGSFTSPNFTHTIPGDYWERLVSVAATLTTSATAGSRDVNLQYIDGDGFIFNLSSVLNNIGPSETISAYGDLNYTAPVGLYGGVTGSGTITSPGAGVNIAVTSAIPAGSYQVTVAFELSGTVAAGTDNNNISLGCSGGTPAAVTLENNIGTNEQIFGPIAFYNPGNAFTLKTIAAGTSGSVYSATITAVQSSTGAEFTIPDFTLKSGWGVQLAIVGAQTGDTIGSVGLLVERYASNFANGGEAEEQDAWLRELIHRSGG
jgi:hypothetical protein